MTCHTASSAMTRTISMTPTNTLCGQRARTLWRRDESSGRSSPGETKGARRGLSGRPAILGTGIDSRYAELASLLAPYRQAPADAGQLVGRWWFVEGARDRIDGVGYLVRRSPSR